MGRQRKMTAHSCCLSLSAVSHLNEQSFSCGHPHEYFNRISLSPYSVSWSNRPASQAKTWASCALAFAPAPLPPLPTQILTQNVASAYLCILILGFTPPCLYHCHPIPESRFKKKRELWRTGGHPKHAVSRIGIQFSHRTNQPNARHSGSILTNFLRLLLSKYPPCGSTALSIMW